MILSDNAILKERRCGLIGITPFNAEQLQPSSYDLTLGREFKTFRAGMSEIDFNDPRTYADECYQTVEADEYVLEWGRFALAHTVETFCLTSKFQAQVCGKSSLGRLGLFVENAGFVDPGFCGQLTLELYNCSSRPIRLRAGMRIAQIAFYRVEGEPSVPYGDPALRSHYQGQMGATVSRGSF